MSVEESYKKVQEVVSELFLKDKLSIAANIIFDAYPELKKQEVLVQGIELPELKYLEDFYELNEVYSFKQESLVYRSLSAAHELLTLSALYI